MAGYHNWTINHLLTRAAALGGWLPAGHACRNDDYRAATRTLLDDSMWVEVLDGHPDRYELTASGMETALSLLSEVPS